MQAFVDESKRSGYLVAAVCCAPADVETLRRSMRSLLLPGQASVHLRKENERRQRHILSAVSRLPVRALVVTCPGKDMVEARARCLRRTVELLRDRGTDRLTIELADGDLDADRRTLYDVVGPSSQDGGDPFVYLHVRRATEPGLWAADAVAWAFAKGGEWRRRLGPLSPEVVRL